MNIVLKKDDSVKNNMLSSMGAAIAGPAQSSGAEFIFWLANVYRAKQEAGLKAKYDAMTAPERVRCDWLQNLASAFLLYHMKDNLT